MDLALPAQGRSAFRQQLHLSKDNAVESTAHLTSCYSHEAAGRLLADVLRWMSRLPSMVFADIKSLLPLVRSLCNIDKLFKLERGGRGKHCRRRLLQE